ncbi:MAG TPA: ATP-binding cassette domain-containing protein [candidate division Zixibacteria bacterium]|nr:ATP-binding cassette domain-containing protein [candidate division Zixibacteria bacterium]
MRTLFTRRYTATRAVDDVSFSIDAGELVGYLGPNGAGKSTTIKMLTGILEPTSGEAEVAGVVPWRDRQANALNIGVVFGQRSQLWWDLPLIESFELVAQMYHVEPDRYRRNLGRFREILALDEFIDTPVRQLSLGQRMRGELTAALLHDPPVVYLDEPTVGLYVVANERRTFIADINRERGTTVVLTTHDLADVERLCRRVILIDHGRVLFDGSVDRLKATYAPQRELVVQLVPDAAGLEVGAQHSKCRASCVSTATPGSSGSGSTRPSCGPTSSSARSRAGIRQLANYQSAGH